MSYMSVSYTKIAFIGDALDDNIEEDQEYVNPRLYDVTEDWAKQDNFPHQLQPHPCDRVCKKDEPKRCHFVFIVERHTSMGKVSLNRI